MTEREEARRYAEGVFEHSPVTLWVEDFSGIKAQPELTNSWCTMDITEAFLRSLSASEADDPPMRWLGLSIRSAPPADGDTGTVEFIARYRSGGRAGQIHELSRFRREHDRWFYVDGDIQDD
ncbi:MAG TPA: YchJ family metal-binding protein [Denitromonas sp.]|nr:YchJ family metal-binding protein [Denitromonas sp.]